MRPQPNEHHPYFSTYIDLVPEESVIPVLRDQFQEVQNMLGGLDSDTVSILHPPYTWTLLQVLGHCIDTERVFAYRICRFAVSDATELPGFDQDDFVANTDFSQVTMAALLDEFKGLRDSNIRMLERYSPEVWNRQGTADGNSLSVRAAAFILAGHIRHHLRIIKKRLGLSD